MKIIRVFAGDDGESHFEEVSFAEMQGMVDRVGPGDINVNRREAPNFSDYHQAPRRQYVVNLEGIAEFRVRRRLQGATGAWRHPGGRGPLRPRPHRPLALCRDAHLPGRTPSPSRTRSVPLMT